MSEINVVPLKTVYNCETGKQETLPLTEEEMATLQADIQANAEFIEQQRLDFEAKRAAKESAIVKLKALGLTESEAEAIAGI